MSLPTRTALALVLVLAATALVAAPSGASEPAAHAARACHLSAKQGKKLGATYTSNLRVHNTGCTTGKRVAKGFNTCRQGHSASSCNPFGYNCAESHVANSPAQRSARVKCKKGSKVVAFAYTDNK
jgi:hypothetical protein